MQKNNSIEKIALSSLLLSLIALSSSSSFAKEYYKWVDSKGSTHYTSTPPPKNTQKHGKVDTYGLTSSTQHAAPSTPQTNTNQSTAAPSTNLPAQQQSSNLIQPNEAPASAPSKTEPAKIDTLK